MFCLAAASLEENVYTPSILRPLNSCVSVYIKLVITVTFSWTCDKGHILLTDGSTEPKFKKHYPDSFI